MEFQFKQFTVQQSDSAAKITTDATVFAASLPLQKEVKQVLEIGTGTGVMSLMLRQRQQIQLDAVELEQGAYEEAKLNFENSPFKDDLAIFHTAVQDFSPSKRYDLIFSNPPFFTDNLRSEINPKKNLAYHTESLSFDELAESIHRLLADEGKAFVMLPHYESLQLDKVMIAKGFFINENYLIKHNINKAPLRRIVGYSYQKNDHPEFSILIRELDGQFSMQYKALMQPYLTIF